MIPYSDEYLLQYMATLTTENYTSGLEKMKKQTENTTSSINGNFSKMGNIIGKVAKSKLSLAAAVVYFGNKTRQAVQDMVAFQKQLSTVNTLLKGSQEELSKFGNEFVNLSIRTGQAKEDIANGAYQALSSGIAKEDLMNFLEVATKTAQAGLTTTETSIRTLSSVLNAYKMTAVEAGTVADWLLTVQNKGVTTVGELGAYLSDVTSIAAPLNVSLNDVGAALAQMTQNGNNTAKSTTMLKSMLSELSKEGQAAADTFKEIAGQSFRDFIKNGGDLQGALKIMSDYAVSSNKSIVDLFGSIEAGSAALNLTGLNAEAFNQKLEDMKKSSGELNTAYAIATANIKSEWDKLCNAMDSKWRKLALLLEKPIYITLKTVRKAVDGDEDAFEDYEKNKAEVTRLEAEQQKFLKIAKESPGSTAGIRVEQIGKQIEKLNKQIKIVEDKMKADEARAKELEEEKARKAAEEAARLAKEAELQAIQDKNEAIEDKEKQHKNNLNVVEINYLNDKKNFIKEQQRLLDLGIISKDEYDRNIKIKDKELLEQQQKANLELYKEVENFYTQLGELDKANQFKKKVIEVELKITQNTTLNAENREDLFLQEEAQKRKKYQAELLENEWQFLTNLAEMREENVLNESRIEEIKERRMKELEMERLIQETEELQNRLNFYNSNIIYKEKAVETLKAIEENALKRDKLTGKKRMDWIEWKNMYEVEIQKRSVNAIMDTYTALAKGQIKSLDDFKKFAQMQIAELLLAKGQEHAAEAISEGGKAIIDFASAATATARMNGPQAALFIASAKNHLAASAQNAALAAAFGVASSAISPSESSSSSGSGGKTKFDDGINDRVEASKESEGTVYIDVSDSQMAKVMIKQIEKELKDGYNVTLIGKKKR